MVHFQNMKENTFQRCRKFGTSVSLDFTKSIIPSELSNFKIGGYGKKQNCCT